MSTLFLIPARGGSKRLPGKNIRPLLGKPVIRYTIEAAKKAVANDDEVFVTSDSDTILQHAADVGTIHRPSDLATDQATSEQVIRHAIEHLREHDKFFETIVLLQPTSPLRSEVHILEALKLFNRQLDMVVSVSISNDGNEDLLFTENSDGFLSRNQQEDSVVYKLNGAIYIFDTQRFLKHGFTGLEKRLKYVMSKEESVDIDILEDFNQCIRILQSRSNDS